MYSPLQAAAKYFKYYVQGFNSKGHGMHSPFVYEFITKVMNDFTHYPAYDRVEELRHQLLKDKTNIEVADYGAGSAKKNTQSRTLSSIAKNAAKPSKYAQLLFRMVQYYKAQTVLELGTSLGLTTSYLALANAGGSVMTLEGSDRVADVAASNFSSLGLSNIEMVRGNFDDTLHTVLSNNLSLDFVFIDGNHRLEPTLRYFEQILPHTHNDTLLVFDDIHWSKEMETAWSRIVQHDAVACDIDLFHIGIISLRQEFREKQQFTIRF